MSPGSTKQMSYAGALADGVYQAMANDERVSLISGHLLGLGPHAALMQRIYDDFHDRIFACRPSRFVGLAEFHVRQGNCRSRPLPRGLRGLEV